MKFKVTYGFPEIQQLMVDLKNRRKSGNLSKDEIKFYNKLGKCFSLLSHNPRHNSLASHEIKELSNKFGKKVFESYMENKKPAAGRIFWAYGPAKEDITILAIELHPDDKKKDAYKKIKLSNFPNDKKK